MIKIKILSVGKTREKWLEEACEEYIKRLTATVRFEFLWAKDTPQLIEWAKKESNHICLDPAGTLMDSIQLSHFLSQSWEERGSKISFIIGGAEGLPKEIKQNATLISLSPLTFTHQITRLILIEQIYRATEIAKGTGYHK